MATTLPEIFEEIKQALKKYAKGAVEGRETILDSKAKGGKLGYHLYGKKKVRIMGRQPQPTYVAGVIMQKNYVSFYSMPVYSHPTQLRPQDSNLKKFKKGKSCFNITELDRAALRDVERLVREGVTIYKQEGWI
jgi:hypothetical protein